MSTTRSTYASREEHAEVLVQQILIDGIAQTEALQKLVSKTHHFVHSHISLL